MVFVVVEILAIFERVFQIFHQFMCEMTNYKNFTNFVEEIFIPFFSPSIGHKKIESFSSTKVMKWPTLGEKFLIVFVQLFKSLLLKISYFLIIIFIGNPKNR